MPGSPGGGRSLGSRGIQKGEDGARPEGETEVPQDEDPTRRGTSPHEAQGGGAALPIWGSPHAAPGSRPRSATRSILPQLHLGDCFEKRVLAASVPGVMTFRATLASSEGRMTRTAVRAHGAVLPPCPVLRDAGQAGEGLGAVAWGRRTGQAGLADTCPQ